MQGNPKEKTLVLKFPKPFEFESKRLGVLHVGTLTMNVLTKLSPELNSELTLSEDDYIYFLLHLIVAKNNDNKDKITIEEAKSLFHDELNEISLSILRNEGWLGKDSSNPDNPRLTLINKVQQIIESIGKSTKDILKSFESTFSPKTNKLFMQNVALSEQLKEIAGLTSVGSAYAKMMSDQKVLIEKLSKDALNAATIGDTYKSIMSANEVLHTSGYKKLYDSLSLNQSAIDVAKSINFLKFDNKNFAPTVEPEIFSVHRPIISPITQLNGRADKLLDTTKETNDKLNHIAGAIGVMNELMVNAQLELEKKHQDDLESNRLHSSQLEMQHQENALNQQKSMNVAVVALVISAFLSAASLYYTKKSYELSIDKEQQLVPHDKANQLPKQLPTRADKKIGQGS